MVRAIEFELLFSCVPAVLRHSEIELLSDPKNEITSSRLERGRSKRFPVCNCVSSSGGFLTKCQYCNINSPNRPHTFLRNQATAT